MSLFLAYNATQAQDIDFFIQRPGDRFKFEQIPDSMTLDEFELLERHLRMRDMLYAMIVPGYTHFRAKEAKAGYIILGIRSAAYISLFAIGLDSGLDFRELMHLNYYIDPSAEYDRIKLYTGIAVIATATIFATYFYDWIRGQYILEKKQNAIRFKYSRQISIAPSLQPTGQHNIAPGIGIQMRF